MLAAIGVDSIDELFEQIPERACGSAGRSTCPTGQRGRGLRAAARAGRAQRRRRSRDQLPRRRDVRPLRAGDRRRDHQPLRVPDPVHAVPARDLPGRPAGDVRVPDGDVGADRPAGLQRRPLRGPVRGRRGRLPGDRRDKRPQRFVVSRGVHPHSRETLATYAAGYGAEVVEVAAGRTASPTPPRSPAAIDDDTAAVFLQNPNFLGAVEDVEALGEAAKRARRAARRRRSTR